MRCIRIFTKVRGIDSYVYRVGHDKTLTDKQVGDFQELINSNQVKVDNWLIILFNIDDHRRIEKIIFDKGYNLITDVTIKRIEKLDKLLEI